MSSRRIAAFVAVAIGAGLALAPVGWQMFAGAPKGRDMIVSVRPCVPPPQLPPSPGSPATVGPWTLMGDPLSCPRQDPEPLTNPVPLDPLFLAFIVGSITPLITGIATKLQATSGVKAIVGIAFIDIGSVLNSIHSTKLEAVCVR